MEHDDQKPSVERRLHPAYARRTAAMTYGLVAAGLACLLLGIVVRGTAWRNAETVLNVAFCGAVVALLIQWFGQGESTECPECGRRLSADPDRDRSRSLTFTCPDCRIEWDTRGLHET